MENYIVTPELFKELGYVLLERLRSRGIDHRAILCPLRGGFYLSYFMSRHLEIPLSYIEITSYEGKQQTRFQIGIRPELVEGRILLCDDLYDSGNTARKIHSLYPRVQFDTVCLVSKIDTPEIMYGTLVERDRWVDFFWETM
jgi:hypoxanthine phosphoribosyltransferase